MSMSLKNSIIICTRNRTNDLIACLNSLARQTVLPDELIIVDSSDQPLGQDFVDNLSRTLRQASSLRQRLRRTQQCEQENEAWVQGSEILIQYHHTKPGLTYQRNIGIDHAHGDIIYFFDDDVILRPDYIERMQEAFDRNPAYKAGMGDIANIDQNPSRKYQFFRKIFLLPRQRASGNFTWSGM